MSQSTLEPRTPSAVASPEPSPTVRADDGSRTWRLEALALLAALFLFGCAVPLFDPDLPMHLATGEWIVRHGKVPFVEPFAWTRAGDPYFSYSWLPELAYYLGLLMGGPLALHVLNGLTFLAIGMSAYAAGRLMGCERPVCVALAGTNVIVGMQVTAALRPQQLLLVVLPLLWGVVWRIVQGGPSTRRLLAATALSAVAANSHLFFVVTAAPLAAFLMADGRIRWRSASLTALAIGAGWLLTPYALHWIEVFRLFFGPNAFLARPSPISEFQPGFEAVVARGRGMLAVVIPLVLLPWFTALAPLSWRERGVGALLWVGGLFGFGFAVRLLSPWWLVVLPVFALTLNRWPGDWRHQSPRLRFRLPVLLLIVVGVVNYALKAAPFWAQEGDAEERRLATRIAQPAEVAATWLQSQVRPGSDGRILTVFNYGSYLTWRLPSMSVSIDGRTIFPDSVALPQTFIREARGREPLDPWQSADLAILGARKRVAAVLDTASGWRRVASIVREGEKPDTVGLWVEQSWWDRNATAPQPPTAVVLRYREPGD